MNNFFGTLKNKTRPPFILIWLGWIISSFLGIIDGIINILTLCMWFPNFQMKWIFWWGKKQINIIKINRNK